MRGVETIDRIWNTTSSADDAMAATHDVYAMLQSLIDIKRLTPGDDLTKADASRLIEELQAETGRGR